MTSYEENEELVEKQYFKIVDQVKIIKDKDEIIERLETENENIKVNSKKCQLNYAWENCRAPKMLKVETQNTIDILSSIDFPKKRRRSYYIENELIQEKDENIWGSKEYFSYEDLKNRLKIIEKEKQELEKEKEIMNLRVKESISIKEKFDAEAADYKININHLTEKQVSCEDRIKYLEDINQKANDEIKSKTNQYELELRKNEELQEKLKEKENENKSLLHSLENIKSEYLNCTKENPALIKENNDLRSHIKSREEFYWLKENEINIKEQIIFNLNQENGKLMLEKQAIEKNLNTTIEELNELKNISCTKNSNWDKINNDLEESNKNYEKARLKLIEDQGIIGEYKSQLINQGAQVKFYYENIIAALEETISDLSDQLSSIKND